MRVRRITSEAGRGAIVSSDISWFCMAIDLLYTEKYELKQLTQKQNDNKE
jgi:hypothetical protein